MNNFSNVCDELFITSIWGFIHASKYYLLTIPAFDFNKNGFSVSFFKDIQILSSSVSYSISNKYGHSTTFFVLTEVIYVHETTDFYHVVCVFTKEGFAEKYYINSGVFLFSCSY